MTLFQQYAPAIAVGYLLGCLNLAWLLGRRKNINLKQSGSGNLGASNTVLHMGLASGAAVAAHDILKAVLAVLIAQILFPGIPCVGYAAGAAAVLGHIAPFWLKFSGGKGFAPFIGFMMATDWRAAIVILAIGSILVFATDYIVTATFTSIILYPLSVIFLSHNLTAGLIVSAVSVIIFIKHIENIRRILGKQESSVRSALRGRKTGPKI